jgi:hypothetical protein
MPGVIDAAFKKVPTLTQLTATEKNAIDKAGNLSRDPLSNFWLVASDALPAAAAECQDSGNGGWQDSGLGGCPQCGNGCRLSGSPMLCISTSDSQPVPAPAASEDW